MQRLGIVGVTANPCRDLRRKAGFSTQKDLAAAVGMHRSSISYIECGARPCPKLLKMFLEVSVENIELKEEMERRYGGIR